MTRLENEAEFHNRILDQFRDKDTVIAPYFEAITALENAYILTRMGNLEGKRILDFACGTGEASIYFTLKGAKVSGVDVSEKALEIANDLARKNHVRPEFILSKKEGLEELPAESFDFVYGNGALHHVDCVTYYPEFKRVLRPGGKAYFIEPQKYNPVIHIYRKLAKEVRSPDEKPVGIKELRLAEKYFGKVSARGFWLFSLYLFCHFYCFAHADPNRERYWRKVILDAEKYRKIFTPLHSLDQFILRLCPPLKYLCWNLVLEFEKTVQGP